VVAGAVEGGAVDGGTLGRVVEAAVPVVWSLVVDVVLAVAAGVEAAPAALTDTPRPATPSAAAATPLRQHEA
jgi:hypothetical protein